MKGWRGLSTPLWPIRYKPFPDELLSSWLMRIAHGHGLKVQTFCNLIFGSHRQVWNRDIDRLGPDWLLDTLVECTGTPRDVAFHTTLRAYEGQLFRRFRSAGALQWIQTLMMYHRKRQGYGMQLCPKCLREGTQPYYRRIWRISFCTICPHHNCMLLDRCPDCGAGISFHRTDVGNYQLQELAGVLVRCHQCGLDISQTQVVPILAYDDASLSYHIDLCTRLCHGEPQDIDLMCVLHHLGMLMLGEYRRLRLQAHVCKLLDVALLPSLQRRASIESLSLIERHHFMLLIGWLMQDLEERLHQARYAKAVRYLHLVRDFHDPPIWYREITDRMEHKRRRHQQQSFDPFNRLDNIN